MTRETLLRLDRALDDVQRVLEEIPYPESMEFVKIAGETSEARIIVSRKLDALAAGRYNG